MVATGQLPRTCVGVQLVQPEAPAKLRHAVVHLHGQGGSSMAHVTKGAQPLPLQAAYRMHGGKPPPSMHLVQQAMPSLTCVGLRGQSVVHITKGEVPCTKVCLYNREKRVPLLFPLSFAPP